MELLVRPADEHNNLDRCRLVAHRYEIPDQSEDFIFTYEFYNYHLPPLTEEEAITENSDGHISSYNGYNWQKQDENPGSVTNTESRAINSTCPICQEEFTNEQNIAKFRCASSKWMVATTTRSPPPPLQQ